MKCENSLTNQFKTFQTICLTIAIQMQIKVKPFIKPLIKSTVPSLLYLKLIKNQILFKSYSLVMNNK